MSKFNFLEYAVGSPVNRGHYDLSKKIIQMPFKKENRFKEFWRSMYLFKTENPTEDSPMFGNFYLETDEPNFSISRRIMLDTADYLHNKFKIPYTYFDFFLTNRSIWLVIPAKTFGSFGIKKLHIIHKEMASEINHFLLLKEYKKTIDLSIYRWNGLIHSLGSYLPNSKRWVTKFSYFDLESSLIRDDLITAKYDNYWDYSDIEIIPAAKDWFYSFTKSTYTNYPKPIMNNKSCNFSCMKKLEDKGSIEDNRNLHIYTYSLYLKEIGYSFKDALLKIKETFSNRYVLTKESDRTVRSAFKGKKHFSCKMVKTVLSPELIDNNNCTAKKTTFIIPRDFISSLNESKAHYEVYKYLLKILHSNQVLNTPYKLNIKGEKYKHIVVSYFEKLKELGFISYTLHNDIIETKLTIKERRIYKSHVVIPVSFLESKFFKNADKEIKLLLELLRTSIRTHKGTIFFNVKIQTLIKNIRSTSKTVYLLLFKLRKNKMLLGRYLFLQDNNKVFKEKLKEMISKIKTKTENKIVKWFQGFKQKIDYLFHSLTENNLKCEKYAVVYLSP